MEDTQEDTRQFTQAEITATANIIRSTYQVQKTRALGRPYNPGTRVAGKSEDWQKAAINALKCRANPAAFVEAAFTFCTVKGGPNPNQLTGRAAVRWWHQSRGSSTHFDPARSRGDEVIIDDTAEEDLKILLMDAFQYCLCKSGHPWPHPEFIKVLARWETPISPVVKTMLGFPDPLIIQRYLALAKNILQEQRSFYDAALFHKLPVHKILLHQLSV
jgi:hypothetical protein